MQRRRFGMHSAHSIIKEMKRNFRLILAPFRRGAWNSSSFLEGEIVEAGVNVGGGIALALGAWHN